MNCRVIDLDEWRGRSSSSNGTDNFFQNLSWNKTLAQIFTLDILPVEVDFAGRTYTFCFHQRNKAAFMPFIGYGNVLGGKLTLTELEKIIQQIEESCNIHVQRVKMRSQDLKNDSILPARFSVDYATVVSVPANLSDYYTQLDKTTRYSICQAERAGLVIREVTADEVEQFYPLYVSTMQRVQSEYLTPIALFAYLAQAENSLLLGAWLGEQLVAGSVYLCSPTSWFYWWNATSDRGRKTCANYLLTFHALQRAAENQVKFLDMATSHNERIERSKTRWGGVRQPIFIRTVD